MDASALAVLLGLLLAATVGAVLGALWTRARTEGSPAVASADRTAMAVMKDSLDRLHDQMRDLEGHRVSWQAQLRQHVDDVRRSTEGLRHETAALSTALRRPQVRGRWGELHLRRAVELAGLVSRCDFTEQATLRSEDQTRRPDLVVHLAGGRHVVVDAKVPLDAFLDATSAADQEARAAALTRHARQLRSHVDRLSQKAYWRLLPSTPEFVVLFLPGESFLSAALEADEGLLEHAAVQRVVLATPSTLIALLRTVAFAWTQESLAARAQEVHDLGRELHSRIGTWAAHLDRVGRSLGAAVGSYNAAVGSLESRVLVTARRLGELAGSGDLTAPRPLDHAPRSVPAPDAPDAATSVQDPPRLDAPPGGMGGMGDLAGSGGRGGTGGTDGLARPPPVPGHRVSSAPA